MKTSCWKLTTLENSSSQRIMQYITKEKSFRPVSPEPGNADEVGYMFVKLAAKSKQ